MSTPLEDFIVSLGFDTSKVKTQIQQLHKELDKLAVNVDTKRVAQARKREKTIADVQLEQAKKTEKEKAAVEQKASKERVQRKKKEVKELTKTQIAEQERRAKVNRTVSGTKRKAEIRTARNVVAEYERGVVGPSNAGRRLEQMIKMNVSSANLRAFTEDFRGKNADTRNRMKSEGLLKSFDSAAASKADLDMMKATNVVEAQRALMKKLGIDDKLFQSQGKTLDQLKTMNEQMKQAIKLKTIENKSMGGKAGKTDAEKAAEKKLKAELAAQKKMLRKKEAEERKLANQTQKKIELIATRDATVSNVMAGKQAGGGLSQYTAQGKASIANAARTQGTARGAASYITAAEGLGRYRHLNASKVDAAVSSGSIDQIRSLHKELARVNAEMARNQRHAINTAAAMGSLRDSTRNAVREYASLYALLAGTSSINRVGQEFEALDSAMLAATGNTSMAADQMQFLTDLSKRLGLSMRDVADQYIKFKFAANGKLDVGQQEELYTNMSELGTVLGLSKDKMKLSFNAVTQMMNKVKVSSEELNVRLAA